MSSRAAWESAKKDVPWGPQPLWGPWRTLSRRWVTSAAASLGLLRPFGMLSVRRNLKDFFVLSSRSIASQHAAQAAQHSVVASCAKLSVRRN